MAGAHRVVIVGSGFGGLFATRALAGSEAEVTLIDRTNHHLFQPLLYQVATGILSQGEIAPATRDVLARYRNVTVLLGEVASIDIARRVVISESYGDRTETPYDSLIVAAGARTSYFGHDELAQFAPGIKTIDDALEIRGRIFSAFEMAERTTDPDERARWLTFVVVGAGSTGVEMAGQIAELSRRTLRRNFRTFDPSDARVLLLDAGDAILPGFGNHLSGKAAEELRRLGIEVHLGVQVTGVDADGVETSSKDPALARIPSRVKVWAAGVRGAAIGEELARAAGVEVDRSGRIPVKPDCTLPGHPDVWVVGDLMTFEGVPGVAEGAMQAGVFAALQIRRQLKGRPLKPRFKYRDLGTVATVARFRAVASIGPLRLSGFPGWLIWAFIHIAMLTGFKNRVSALAHWMVSFIGRSRSERTVTRQQVLARRALLRQPQIED